MWLGQFAFEGLSTCVALLAVTRFDGRMAITMLALLTASFAIVQSIGASLAPRLRAATHTSRVVMSSAVWVLAGLVGALLLLEALTGGGRHRAGEDGRYHSQPCSAVSQGRQARGDCRVREWGG